MVGHAEPHPEQLGDTLHGPALGPKAGGPSALPQPRDEARPLNPGELGGATRCRAGTQPRAPVSPIGPRPSVDGTHGRPDGPGHGHRRRAHRKQPDSPLASLLQLPGRSTGSHAPEYTTADSGVTSVVGTARAS